MSNLKKERETPMLLMEETRLFGKTVSVSPRQRLALRRLLAGEQRKCSATALNALYRRGWVNDATAGYQLTEIGWRVAELSEEIPQGKRLELSLS
jgi:hypothetical protein